jgi:hypothetical protein
MRRIFGVKGNATGSAGCFRPGTAEEAESFSSAHKSDALFVNIAGMMQQETVSRNYRKDVGIEDAQVVNHHDCNEGITAAVAALHQ